MLIYTILTLVLSVIVLILAAVAVFHKNITLAVIATGTVGLFTSVIFLLLAAPDVAMTEAAIGSGLTTVIFFYVLNKIKKNDA